MDHQTASIAKLVQGSELLGDIFGYWPSFHDAEVHSVLLIRDGADGPSLVAKVHLHHVERETDERGYFRLSKHTLTALRFTKVDLDDFSGFNEMNVLMEIAIDILPTPDEEGRRFAVHFAPSYGFAADFRCRDIAVLSVEPFTPVT